VVDFFQLDWFHLKFVFRDEGGFPHYDVPFGALPAPPVAVPPPPPPGWAGSGDLPPAGFTGASGGQRGYVTGYVVYFVRKDNKRIGISCIM